MNSLLSHCKLQPPSNQQISERVPFPLCLQDLVLRFVYGALACLDFFDSCPMGALPDLTNTILILESQHYCQFSEELKFGPLDYGMSLFYFAPKSNQTSFEQRASRCPILHHLFQQEYNGFFFLIFLLCSTYKISTLSQFIDLFVSASLSSVVLIPSSVAYTRLVNLSNLASIASPFRLRLSHAVKNDCPGPFYLSKYCCNICRSFFFPEGH